MRQMGHQRRGLLLRVCREADRLAVHTGPNFKEALTAQIKRLSPSTASLSVASKADNSQHLIGKKNKKKTQDLISYIYTQSQISNHISIYSLHPNRVCISTYSRFHNRNLFVNSKTILQTGNLHRRFAVNRSVSCLKRQHLVFFFHSTQTFCPC